MPVGVDTKVSAVNERKTVVTTSRIYTVTFLQLYGDTKMYHLIGPCWKIFQTRNGDAPPSATVFTQKAIFHYNVTK